ncbi:cyclin-dependent kinase-like 1 [Aplochiton taeniatus]
MEKYENLGLVGEGSYGMVMKCRHRETGRIVAVKKFLESDEDKTVKKIALREIRMLKQLHHDNLVNLLEVWKKRRRWYLVFEFVERTVLDELEQHPTGLDLNRTRRYLYQILRATAFCHLHNIIHRDIKPENILVSQGGVVKLCDFGFARSMSAVEEPGVYTDYVATRWYRAPELLVGDTQYGRPVDVWAVGCLCVEMVSGQPLFPGDSDIDQLYHIMRCFGNLTARHQEVFYKNPVFSGIKLPDMKIKEPLEQRCPRLTSTALDLTQRCLQMDPERRAQCSELLQHQLFTHDRFHVRFIQELNVKVQKDHRENSTFPKIPRTPRKEGTEEKEKSFRPSSTDRRPSKNTSTPANLPPAPPERSEVSRAVDPRAPSNPKASSVQTRGIADASSKVSGKALAHENPLIDRREAGAVATLGGDFKENVAIATEDRPAKASLSLEPSSTSGSAPLTVITNGNSLVTNGNPSVGAGSHPGTLSLRCLDKARSRGSFYSQAAQQSLSTHWTDRINTTQMISESVMHQRSFLTERERLVAMEKKKPDLLRPPLLPELRGTEGGALHRKAIQFCRLETKEPRRFLFW